MKAVVLERYGGPEVLRVADLPEPPRAPGEARVEVRAAALNPKDVMIRKGQLRWLVGHEAQRIVGYDIAGILLDEASGIPAGSEVFGMIQAHRGGACAEVARLPFRELGLKPTGLSMGEAASLPLAGMTALQGLRDELGVRPGHRVLLNGASGGVGTLAVQIAKALDAEVIAVCSHRNVDRMHELGADRVVDYEKKDPASLRNLDAVFDIYGSLPWPRARASLRRNGRYCTTIPKLGNIARGMGRKVGLHRAALVVVKSRRSDLALLARWVNEGKLRPVIDRVLPLSQCADGHRRLESRRTQGKVVIEIGAA